MEFFFCYQGGGGLVHDGFLLYKVGFFLAFIGISTRECNTVLAGEAFGVEDHLFVVEQHPVYQQAKSRLEISGRVESQPDMWFKNSHSHHRHHFFSLGSHLSQGRAHRNHMIAKDVIIVESVSFNALLNLGKK